MNTDSDRLSCLVRRCRVLAELEGLPPELLISQIMLASVGVAGSKLTWKSTFSTTPHFGRASVTFLGSRDDSAEWFLRQLQPIRDWQQLSLSYANGILQRHPKPAEIRERRRHAKMIGNYLPSFTKFLHTPPVTGPGVIHPDLLIEVNPKIGAYHVKPNGFGRDRFVLLNGAGAYRALMRNSSRATPLRLAAVNEGSGLRTTLHGWSPRRDFHLSLRKKDPSELVGFGWLLPADRLPGMQRTDSYCPRIWEGVYRHPLLLRYLGSFPTYRPDGSISSLLYEGDTKDACPVWGHSPDKNDLLRPLEQLAWQFAPVLKLISREMKDDPQREAFHAKFAVELASWVRAAHAKEVRLLYPGPPECPADEVSCTVADKLRLGPQSVRDLVRSCHSVKTEVIRSTLARMQSEGWVKEEGKDLWKLCFPPLPELSAILSEIAKIGNSMAKA